MKKVRTYSIRIEEENGKMTMNRQNDGFTAFELLGVLEYTKNDIIKQMAGEVNPDVIEKVIIKEANR